MVNLHGEKNCSKDTKVCARLSVVWPRSNKVLQTNSTPQLWKNPWYLSLKPMIRSSSSYWHLIVIYTVCILPVCLVWIIYQTYMCICTKNIKRQVQYVTSNQIIVHCSEMYSGVLGMALYQDNNAICLLLVYDYMSLGRNSWYLAVKSMSTYHAMQWGPLPHNLNLKGSTW